MDKFLVRPVKKEDSKRVWEIKNLPSSRKYSGNPAEIPFEKHALWFARKYFSGEDNYCFVLENESGLVIGYCRLDFDAEHDYWVISIALDDSFRAKGLGHYFLSEVLRRKPREKNIFAEVQKENIASVKLFQKNNFKIRAEDKKNYYLEFISFDKK